MIMNPWKNSLGLTPYGKAGLMGIGGDNVVDTYRIHVLLPNGFLVDDLKPIAAI